MTVTTMKRAGRYRVKKIAEDDDRDAVEITHMPHLHGWVAAANWDRYLYSDPIVTLRQAKITAERMLRERK